MIDATAVTKAAQEIEPLPTSVARLASLVADPDPDVDAIVEVVALDQALTLRFLRLANAAYGASRARITTVREAVLRLGIGRLLSFTMGSFVRARMSQALREYGLGEHALWCHSVAAALATELMSSVSKRRFPAEVFTTALLHDVGKLVLCRFLTPEVLQMLDRARPEGQMAGAGWYDSEREILMLHHGEVGGLVAQHWGLPDSMVRGIIYHHEPEADGGLVALATHLSDVLAHSIDRADDDVDDLRLQFHARCEAADIAPSAFDTLRAAVTQNYDAVMSSYGGSEATRSSEPPHQSLHP